MLEIIRGIAIRLKRSAGLVGDFVGAGTGAVEPEQVDERRLAGIGILLGALAQLFGGRFGVEQVVGNLEGKADAVGIGAQRLAVACARLAENGAGLA